MNTQYKFDKNHSEQHFVFIWLFHLQSETEDIADCNKNLFLIPYCRRFFTIPVKLLSFHRFVKTLFLAYCHTFHPVLVLVPSRYFYNIFCTCLFCFSLFQFYPTSHDQDIAKKIFKKWYKYRLRTKAGWKIWHSSSTVTLMLRWEFNGLAVNIKRLATIGVIWFLGQSAISSVSIL